MMLKGYQFREECKVSEWIFHFGEDQDLRCREWIWRQLFGETAHGDDLVFSIVQMNSDKLEEQIYCGILKDQDGNVKAVVPAMYQREEDGLFYLVDYTGSAIEGHVNIAGNDDIKRHDDVDMDEIGKRFMTAGAV